MAPNVSLTVEDSVFYTIGYDDDFGRTDIFFQGIEHSLLGKFRRSAAGRRSTTIREGKLILEQQRRQLDVNEKREHQSRRFSLTHRTGSLRVSGDYSRVRLVNTQFCENPDTSLLIYGDSPYVEVVGCVFGKICVKNRDTLPKPEDPLNVQSTPEWAHLRQSTSGIDVRADNATVRISGYLSFFRLRVRSY